MDEQASAAIAQYFGDLTDPRVDRTKLHKLIDILVLAICAVLAGADSWEDVADVNSRPMFTTHDRLVFTTSASVAGFPQRVSRGLRAKLRVSPRPPFCGCAADSWRRGWLASGRDG